MVKLIYNNIFIFYNITAEKPEVRGEGAEGEAEREEGERGGESENGEREQGEIDGDETEEGTYLILINNFSDAFTDGV